MYMAEPVRLSIGQFVGGVELGGEGPPPTPPPVSFKLNLPPLAKPTTPNEPEASDAPQPSPNGTEDASPEVMSSTPRDFGAQFLAMEQKAASETNLEPRSLEGWLWKKGRKVRLAARAPIHATRPPRHLPPRAQVKSWKRRYAMVRAGVLCYYKDDTCSNLRGSMPLTATAVTPCTLSERDTPRGVKGTQQGFELKHQQSGRTLMAFPSPDADDQEVTLTDSWVQLLRNAISEADAAADDPEALARQMDQQAQLLGGSSMGLGDEAADEDEEDSTIDASGAAAAGGGGTWAAARTSGETDSRGGGGGGSGSGSGSGGGGGGGGGGASAAATTSPSSSSPSSPKTPRDLRKRKRGGQ